MDLTRLDASVHRYCHSGLAASTHKAYKAALNHFQAFCNRYGIINPFPINELLLCRFTAFLADEGLAPARIKAYLSGIRHGQVIQGFPEPRKDGAMPRLKLLQTGVSRARAEDGTPPEDNDSL